MIYVYAKYQKLTPYIKRDIANLKVFLPRRPAGRPDGRPDGRPAGRNRHYIDSHCIACESTNNKLALKQQLSITQRNVSHKLCLFKKIRNCLSNKAAKDVLKAMVLSYIDYANILFTLCNKADNDKLQVLQNNAMRMCCNIRNPRESSVRQLHEDLNLLTVQNRRYVTLLCCIYRHVKSGYIQTVERTEAHTRANMTNIIKLPIAWSNQFQNSPFYCGAKMWNALPISLRSAVDLKGFKKELKSRLALCQGPRSCRARKTEAGSHRLAL